MNWRYHNPVDVHFGPRSLAQLPALTAGRSVVAVVFPEARAVGVLARLESLLGASLVQVIDRTESNPDVASLAALYESFWATTAPAEVIVAVGGGSVIDTAKALMVGTDDRRFASLIALLAGGTPFVPHAVKPLIAVPTTAGTGSEVTPWATIWDHAAQRKYSLHLPQTWPTAAIVDPELTVSLPAAATLAAALDALSHALESIWNINANPISDAHAVAAAMIVLDVLPKLMQDRANLALRSAMSRAALLAGLAFSNTRTALAHSISYEMTLRHGLAHGIACSFTLPLVLARATGADSARDRVLAQVFGDDLAAAPARLAGFLERLGVSTRFDSYGVDAASATRMVEAALDGVRGRNFIGAAKPPPTSQPAIQ
ncbi:MAG: iron-containing alcohol dehydrogenase PsrA [Casimicrobiaceae bacterium]